MGQITDLFSFLGTKMGRTILKGLITGAANLETFEESWEEKEKVEIAGGMCKSPMLL
jgi:hypothetical protein